MKNKFVLCAVIIICTTTYSVGLNENVNSEVYEKNTLYVADFNAISAVPQPKAVISDDLGQKRPDDVISRGNDTRLDVKARIIAKIIQRDGEFGEDTPEDIKIDIANTIIEECAKYEGADPILIASMIDVESKFRYTTTCSGVAHGIMQITTSTGAYIADKMCISSYDLNNYKDCIKMGIYYYMENCVEAWAYEDIQQKDPRSGVALTKYQMGLMTYNGNTRTARKLSNIEYIYAVEEAMSEI